jgi:hypothetical protein
MGFHISIPPVGCRSRTLVRVLQHPLMIVALHQLQFHFYRLEPIISIHQLHNMREGQWLSALKISKLIPRRWWWCLRLSMNIDHGLLHGLEHLGLHSQHLLRSWRRGGAGGELGSWLFSPLLFSTLLLAARFLVLAI